MNRHMHCVIMLSFLIMLATTNSFAAAVITLNNGQAVSNLSGSAGNQQQYKIYVPSGQAILVIKTSGGTGDCDFDVENPSGTVAGRSVLSTNSGLVQIDNPAVGDWLINLYGNTAYTGVSLLAQYSKTAPPMPSGLLASDGLYLDKVLLNWTATVGATSYEVWRGLKPTPIDLAEPATKIGEVTDNTFEDIKGLEVGKVYNYWLKAMNAAGTSAFSALNSGYITKIPATPASVTASNGTYFDKIAVTWPKVIDATSYQLYRSPAKTITGASAASTCVITATAHGFANGNTVLINGVGGTVGTLLNGKSFAVTVTDANTFSVPVNTALKTYVPGGTAAAVPSNPVGTIVSNSLLTTYTYNDIADISDPNPNPTGAYYYWVKAVNANGASPQKPSTTIGSIKKVVPTGVTATAGTLFGKVRITWTAVPGATGYDVHRYTDKLCTLGEKVFYAGVNPFYEDTDAAVGISLAPYYYKVKAKYLAIYTSDFSLPVAGYHKAMPGPATITASAGTYFGKIRVTWGVVAGATSYEIYRYTDKLCTQNQTIFNAGSNLFYDDTDAAVGTALAPYYYKVRAKYLACTTNFNLTEAAGYNKTMPGPTTVSASAGTYFGKIRVTWGAVAGATSYEIYRYTDKLCTQNQKIFNAGANFFYDDTDAAVGTALAPYYYKVRAKYLSCTTNFNLTPAAGYHKAMPGPVTITASAGTFFGKVRVTWSAVTGADNYELFRDGTSVIVTDKTTYDDALPGDTAKYAYTVKANFGTNTSNSSVAVTGYAASTVTALAAPVLRASKDLYVNIRLSWTEVPLAENYIIYSSTSSDFKYATELTRVSSLAYNDDTAVRGTMYYYWIKSNNDTKLVMSLQSAAVQGRAIGTTKSIADGNTKTIEGGKDSCIYYSIVVPTGKTRLVATLGHTSSAVLNDCDVYAKFGACPTTASYNVKGVENTTGEILTVSNPAAGTWYFMLYGYSAYSDVTLTVNCYSVTDIVLSQVPLNDQTVPFTANFKGRVVDESGLIGIGGLAVKVRNPITGITSMLPVKTDASGYFTYSTAINTEGEHTFDFFFTTMPDLAKGTASHTVATRKGCLETNNFFDFSAYLPATPVSLSQTEVIGLQIFLDIRNGWDDTGTVNPGDTYETLWVNSTIVKAKDDAQLSEKLDEGLYMFFYGVEGAGVGNDTTSNSALSAVPFVVHVEAADRDVVAGNLNTLRIIDDTQKAAILGGNIGIVAVATLSSPDEATDGYDISLLAREQLEILAKLAAGTGNSIDAGNYSGIPAKKVTLTLANGRKINVVGVGFVK